MDAIVAALGDQQDELSGLMAGMDESSWQTPSRCAGWTVADVLLHLAQSNELAIASVRGHFAEAGEALAGPTGPASSVDDAAELMVRRDRGQAGPAIRARWQHSADTLVEALGKRDPRQRVRWVAGELSTWTLATTRLAETWIHTGDVAAALGRVCAPTDRLWHVARLAWRTLPYAFRRAGRQLNGAVAFELRAPSGDQWAFVPEAGAVTKITGEAIELCLVAARRADPQDTALRGVGPDARAVLELVRTYA